MKKLYALLLLILCCIGSAQAQQMQGANWFFGNGVSLNFSKQQPEVSFVFPTSTGLGNATISNKNGELLFYCKGKSPYTRQYQSNPTGRSYVPMPTYFWTPLGGDAELNMIVQNPGNPQLYNVFFIVRSGPFGSPPPFGTGTTDTTYLYMGQVDMRLNNGYGAIVSNSVKLVHKNPAKKVAALLHSNNRDIWILTHDRFGTNFYAYLLSPSGLAPAVITPTTKLLSGTNHNGYALYDAGRLKSSPNSTLFATNNNANFELFNFDRSTGVPSFRQTLQLPAMGQHINASSCAFSPDSRKFYAGTSDTLYWNTQQPFYAYLYQFDLAASSPIAVQNSRTLLHTFANSKAIFDMQLAIDGKLYLNTGFNFSGTSSPSENYLSRINCPDQAGAACRFRYNEIDLLGRSSGRELPTLNQTIFRNAGILQAQAFRDTICYGDSVQLSAYGAGVEHFQWQAANGLTSPNDTLSNPFVKPTVTTTYTVTGTSVCSQSTASVTVVVLPMPVVTVSGSASVCPQVQGVWYKAQNVQKQQISWGVKGGSIATTSNDSISVNWGNASNTAKVWALPKNRLGCPGDTVFFPVNINVILATEKPNGPDTLCQNEAKNVAYRINKTTGSVYTWSIENGTILSGQSTNSIKVNWQKIGKGKLWVQEESHTSISHCYGISDTLNVFIHPSPDSVKHISGPAQVFTFAENQVYAVQEPQPGLTYHWQINGGAITSGQNSDKVSVNWQQAGAGQVEVAAMNQFGCESKKAQLKVEISGAPQPVFYNIITPNNDGKNDAFVIENLKWYQENELVMYNRWGVEVYRSRNYKNNWQAENVSSGVYFYRFQAGKQSWKGWLEVVK